MDLDSTDVEFITDRKKDKKGLELVSICRGGPQYLIKTTMPQGIRTVVEAYKVVRREPDQGYDVIDESWENSVMKKLQRAHGSHDTSPSDRFRGNKPMDIRQR